MFSLLLAIIYAAFISLGLPDSLLGSAWPVMRLELGASLSFAGVVSMIIAGGTILSSLFSDKLIRRLGVGLITAVSVGMTAGALLGFSFVRAPWQLCLWAVPYGLGAGCVDAALNHYVALHYSSRHMSWLHCFWGVGASISPYIMSFNLARGGNWPGGYVTVSVLQLGLTLILFLALPLWKKKEAEEPSETAAIGIRGALRIKGVPFILIAFFCYCALETTTGLWAASYMAEYRQVDKEVAAQFASLFYLGITFGRFLNGFVADKVGDRRMIRIGSSVVLLGAALMLLPGSWLAPAGLVVIGFGCAPIYPSIIHATPDNFGKENAQSIVSVQIASAYTGSTLVPPLFGLLANHVSLGLFPLFILIFAVVMLFSAERLNHLKRSKTA